jgi:hypothetical protein
MSERRPMLNRHAQDRIGQKLKQDYARLHAPMSDEMTRLVAELLAISEAGPQASSAYSGGHAPRDAIAA